MYGAGPRKKTAAQKAQELFTLLTGQLETEWQSLRSLNLGVKSGTGIVDDLQIRKIQEWVQELHVLVVANTAAADTVAELARQLTKLQRQHLQVMLDVTGHEMLTDFIRISVYNTSNPFASVPIDGPDPAALRAARRLRGRSSGRGAANDVPKSPELRRRPPREEFLRFAGYLPQENALVQQAYSLYLNRLPTEQSGPCSEGGLPSGPSIAQRTSAQSFSQPGAQATGFELQGPSLQEEIEAERRRRLPRQPSIAMWVDVDKRWRSLNHHTQQDELLNPITVLDPIPLYVNSPARSRTVNVAWA
ncbi:hypothetical protein QJQ45_025206 [Haematococcus lacustris]|nr:hypothetical protein QJQ45_025206 [Haematococcus lacustris]